MKTDVPTILTTGARRLTEVKHRDIMGKYLAPNPMSIPTAQARDVLDPEKRVEVLRNFALKGSMHDHKSLGQLLHQSQGVNYQRKLWYDQLKLCAEHPYAAGSIKLYADSVTAESPLTLKSAWVTSEDKKLVNAGNQLFQKIHVDENLRDWTMRLGIDGDIFVKPHGLPGVGVEFVDDSIVPQGMERIDINGRLEGFVWTGYFGSAASSTPVMESPWSYVHGRIFGATKKYMNTGSGMFGTGSNADFLIQSRDPNARKFVYTTKYGCSLLAEALPVWKRVKMTEDTLMLARITRGMMYNMYKIKLTGGNWQQASSMVDQYYEILKRETALDMSNDQWQDSFAPVFAQVQDLYVPTTEDMDVSVEQLGGESVNITGIRDYEEVIKQFLASMNVSKPMLGVEENSGGILGQSSHKRANINFSKAAGRLKGGTKLFLKKLLQIHYAYLGLNADPTRFDVQFATISSAEEEEMKDALSSGIDTIEKYLTIMDQVHGEKVTGEMKAKVFDTLSKRLIGIEELNLSTIVGGSPSKINDNVVKGNKKILQETQDKLHEDLRKMSMCKGDLIDTYLPSNVILNESATPALLRRSGEPCIRVGLRESVTYGEPLSVETEKNQRWDKPDVKLNKEKEIVKSAWKN